MGANFKVTDRSQPMLMPPSVEDWVPEDHLARLVVETVADLDLSSIVGDYNQEGMGGAAYDPRAVLAADIVPEANLKELEQTGVEGFIPSTKSWKLRKELIAAGYHEGPVPQDLDPVKRMELKLRTEEGHQTYKQRGQTIEPTFGQIKHGLVGLPRRGIEAARADWRMLCLAHTIREANRTAREAWRGQRPEGAARASLKKLWRRHQEDSRKAA